MTTQTITRNLELTLLLIKQCADNGVLDLEDLKIKTDECLIYFNMMKQIINPDEHEKDISSTTLRKECCIAFEIPEDLIFTKTRKREIVNARQVFTYCIMKMNEGQDKLPGKIKVGASAISRYIGWDHATHLHSVKTVMKFRDTERMYKTLIPRLLAGLVSGDIAVPEIPDEPRVTYFKQEEGS